MPCTVASRRQARAAARTLRAPDVYVTIQSPREDPTGHWTLDVTIEDPDGPGLPPRVGGVVERFGLWTHSVAAQGPHWQGVFVVDGGAATA